MKKTLEAFIEMDVYQELGDMSQWELLTFIKGLQIELSEACERVTKENK